MRRLLLAIDILLILCAGAAAGFVSGAVLSGAISMVALLTTGTRMFPWHLFNSLLVPYGAGFGFVGVLSAVSAVRSQWPAVRFLFVHIDRKR